MIQSIVDSVTGLLCSVASVLVAPTIILLLLRRFLPVLGDAVWRGYCQLLIWLVMAPVRLAQFLYRQAVSRR